jgi:hypothetical protein
VLEGKLFEPLAYIVNIRERYYFSQVCTFRKAMKIFEVKVDALRFKEQN